MMHSTTTKIFYFVTRIILRYRFELKKINCIYSQSVYRTDINTNMDRDRDIKIN